MLTIPSKGMNVLSMPPPSGDSPDMGKRQRQVMCITLNDQILAQILEAGGKGLSVTFGGSNAVSLHIPCDQCVSLHIYALYSLRLLSM
jgi:hypothetical protein